MNHPFFLDVILLHMSYLYATFDTPKLETATGSYLIFTQSINIESLLVFHSRELLPMGE